MRKAQLTAMLALAILPLLAWVLALSDAGNALVTAYGVWGCLFQAMAISAFSAWLIVSFLETYSA